MKSFWKKLKRVQTGANTLGQINLIGPYLQAELDGRSSNRGIIRVKAQPLAYGANGYSLQATEDYGPDVAEVYWLPWKNGVATVGARAAFEYSKRDIFFMTTTLSGCRFSVTPYLVLHTAHSAGFSSAGRTETEEKIIGDRQSAIRRLSVSAGRANDLRYGGAFVGAYSRALVFGMRVNNQYTYKVLDTYPAPGNWGVLL